MKIEDKNAPVTQNSFQTTSPDPRHDHSRQIFPEHVAGGPTKDHQDRAREMLDPQEATENLGDLNRKSEGICSDDVKFAENNTGLFRDI